MFNSCFNFSFSNIRNNIDYAISRFEAADLCSIAELVQMIDHIRITHELISNYLDLDPFQSMFRAVNDDASLGAFRGRILVHIYSELVGDLLPSFSYNTTSNRFVRSKGGASSQHIRPLSPKNVPGYFWYTSRYNKIFDAANKMYKGFFGKPHLDALLSIVDQNDLPVLVEELCSFLESKVNYELSSYSSALLDALDPMKLPSMKFGVVGGYGYFDLKLKPIARYNLLRSNVFQVLRVIGNGYAFLKFFDTCFQGKGFLNSVFSRFFEGRMPSKDGASAHESGEIPALKILKNAVNFVGAQSSGDLTKKKDLVNLDI
jgi:cytoplasmic FMR1 interacting protein